MHFERYIVKDGQAVPANPFNLYDDDRILNIDHLNFNDFIQSHTYATNANDGVYTKDRFDIVWQWYDIFEFEWRESDREFKSFKEFDNFYMKNIEACGDTRQFAKLKEEVEKPKEYSSVYAIGEKCVICKQGADRKIGEHILEDNPNQMQHELTAYVCNGCFDSIFKRYSTHPAHIVNI